jgi:hypothetical protein
MPFAATRLDASIGTVLSSVPWMMSVDTLNAARSPRKSVLENDFRQSRVALRLACIETLRAHASNSSLTGFGSVSAPKKVRKKPARNLGRSCWRARAVLSKAACSVPAGLSCVFNRNGSTEDTRTACTTDLPP